MRIATRAVAGALLAGAIVATPAQAQINYFTQGFFTSAFCGSPTPPMIAVGGAPIGAVCSGGGFTLTYTPKALNPGLIGSGSVVSLGNFSLTGSGAEISVPSGAVMFTLAIQQTNPTTGVGTTVGSYSGTVRTVPNDFSSLIWVPSPQTVMIGNTSYSLIFDNRGPAAGVGYAIGINNVATPTSIQAEVTATPEPASMTLLATGLIGIFGAARRGRKNRKLVA